MSQFHTDLVACRRTKFAARRFGGPDVTTAFKAGCAYFALVFAAGFVLGTIRVLVLMQRMGERTAVALELQLILSLSWLASRMIIGRL